MERRGSGLKKIMLETQKLPGYHEEDRPVFESSNSYFRVILKNVNYVTPQVTPQVNDITEQQKKILEFCEISRSRKEIMEYCNLTDRKNFTKRILQPLLERQLLKMTIPNKPKSLMD